MNGFRFFSPKCLFSEIIDKGMPDLLPNLCIAMCIIYDTTSCVGERPRRMAFEERSFSKLK